ncbi:hypothetical protein FBEOM_4504 [Fusarium beomiforme]|uniref:C2H2-type domain-containing protein n=1 Tax=Fusarium beomiforme TaxID=44412 RepID=A0A9P5APN4_9HYPO|nr:hypothetical protein FBEOM_4504 [Fusarium beomiforme]
MSWFHGWLRGWLAPLTRERPDVNRGSQSTNSVSSSQTLTSSSRAQNKGTSRSRRVPKRKRANDENDDDEKEQNSKVQRVNGSSGIRMLACPYFKRNPRKYGQPKWKSCAHPGYRDVHRVKKHKLPEYQCRRCREDLETAEALDAHLQQMQACPPSVGNQDGLNQEQVKRMRRYAESLSLRY